MPKLIVMVLIYVSEKVLSFAFKKVLIGAGVGLVAFGVTQLAFNKGLEHVQNSMNVFSAGFYLIDLSGIDIFLALIFSAISLRISLNSGKLGLRKL